jgi:hypothetical protein
MEGSSGKGGYTVTSHLSHEDIEQLTPLLGSLARLVARGSQLSESELRVLLVGNDVECSPPILKEVNIWLRLLKALYEQPTPELRLATVEALMLRTLPEASVLLAVDTVTSRASRATPSTQGQLLKATPPTLDFGMLASDQRASGSFDVQGGPGQIVVDSDQIRVMPTQFGVGTTRVQVEIKPMNGGLLWTSVKLVASRETLEVPIMAQWSDTPVAVPTHQPVDVQQAPDLAAMIQQVIDPSTPQMDTSYRSGQGNPGSNTQQQGGTDGDTELLRQLRQLLG